MPPVFAGARTAHPVAKVPGGVSMDRAWSQPKRNSEKPRFRCLAAFGAWHMVPGCLGLARRLPGGWSAASVGWRCGDGSADSAGLTAGAGGSLAEQLWRNKGHAWGAVTGEPLCARERSFFRVGRILRTTGVVWLWGRSGEGAYASDAPGVPRGGVGCLARIAWHWAWAQRCRAPGLALAGKPD